MPRSEAGAQRPTQTWERFRTWLDAHPDALDALVMDVDGVLLLGNRATAGSRELLERLRAEQRPFLLLTNDGDHSPEEKAAILQGCGLEIQPNEIVSCAHGLATVADELERPAAAPFFIMGNLGTPCYAEAAGLKTTRRLRELSHCRGVIVGEDNYDWQTVINAVVNFFIAHPQAPLITPNPDAYYPDGKGGVQLAAGSVTAMIQSALKTYGKPIVPRYLGKPHGPIFQTAHQRLERAAGGPIDKQRVLMIGDNLDSDVAGAAAFGYGTAIVLTGITTPAMLAAAQHRPDHVWQGL